MRLARTRREGEKAAQPPRRKQDLTSQALKDALAVWEGKCPQAIGLPTTTEFDVLDYLQVMRNISLVEVHQQPLDFVYRVHSLTWAEYAGQDMTGRSLWDHPDPEYRSLIWDTCKRAAQAQESQVIIEEVFVRPALISQERRFRWEALILPLQDDEGTVARLVVVFDMLRLP